MTQKDYIKIAEVLREALLCGKCISELTCDIANMLKADNPRFDLEKFHKAVFH